MNIPEILLREWRSADARTLPGVDGERVRRAFARVGATATTDVLALYEAIGGMEIPDPRDWRLWSLAEVEAQTNPPAAGSAAFSDYLLECWTFRVRTITADVSAVHLDYADGRSPVQVASSLREFLEAMATDPLRVLDPRAHRLTGA